MKCTLFELLELLFGSFWNLQVSAQLHQDVLSPTLGISDIELVDTVQIIYVPQHKNENDMVIENLEDSMIFDVSFYGKLIQHGKELDSSVLQCVADNQNIDNRTTCFHT